MIYSFQQNQTCFIKEVPFRTANCSDAAGRQVQYSTIVEKFLPNATSGQMWDPQQQSPYFNFKVIINTMLLCVLFCLFVCFLVYLYDSVICSLWDYEWNAKSVVAYFKVIFRNLYGRNENNHGRLQWLQLISGPVFDSWTSSVESMSANHYFVTFWCV
jgi:hypothetical protein